MAKTDYPVTPAIRFLREHKITFEPKLYDYVEHGGTAHSAACLGVAEHAVIKTIVLQNEAKQGLIVLMHGDKHISTRNLARLLGMKHIEPADPKQANKWTGFLVGGTSPFGTKTALPVYVEESIWDLPEIYINGGKRGFLVVVAPDALKSLKPATVRVATDD
ncbi:MAG: Cys-tRNA(Pro) deacylase [Neisseria sp.]|uniref:Cys-tRNA(Pro) deacylase n=1 Tax=Neisseria sp. TaxID=192066 RepID=UPI0026DC9563|nr:Cys-tRNA(Pro) deacylase [Neisseria sp.]MDO4640800.1 Cys-tRNA(Pro) deacylase [Neisseria sp.]